MLEARSTMIRSLRGSSLQTAMSSGRFVSASMGARSLSRIRFLDSRAPARFYATKQVIKKGKKSTLELPQGLVARSLPSVPQEEPPIASYPTVIQQVRDNMLKYRDCVLLTRVGSFYELYFEQAEQIGPLLNMKVASKKTALGRVPMAGFPFFQLDRYLKVLVQEHGKHVAISEQTDPEVSDRIKSGGLLFDREVKRVITPGTLIDETFLAPGEHNYLLAVVPRCRNDANIVQDSLETHVGLAWLDLSSGDFFTQSVLLRSLESAVARVSPREIVSPADLDQTFPALGASLLNIGCVVSHFGSMEDEAEADDLHDQFESATARATIDTLSSEERFASTNLLQYVRERLPGLQLRLQDPIRHRPDAFMSIDKNSLRGLEVCQTLKDGLYKGSLLHAVRRTCTESGARLLATRLTAPSMSLPVINERLDLVQSFLKDERLLHEITGLLKRTSDTLRIVQKFSLGRGDADNLLNLANTIHLTRNLGDLLQSSPGSVNACIEGLLARFQWDGPARLADRISRSIDQDGLILNQRKHDLEEAEAAGLARDALAADLDDSDSPGLDTLSKRVSKIPENASDTLPDGEIWIMRRSASPTLSRLHTHLSTLLTQKVAFESSLRASLSATTLTLRFTPGLGHIVHVKGRDARLSLSPSESPSSSDSKIRIVSSSKSTRSFYHADWTALGKSIDDAKLRIRTEESRVFAALREGVIAQLVPLRRNAGILDELDVSSSFARLAKEHRLTRPVLDNSTAHDVKDGRHLMVESNLSYGTAAFTPNDCSLGGDGQARIWLITGPNMAGKSTFLRQSALLSILAQTGSFVPAASAHIGLVDAVFSRVGSADNLSGEQSTFMVEMLETAAILRGATPRSFVIMDEVGRGTTPEDGVAVGWAVLRHLGEVNRSRALFATHFHALGDMAGALPGVACWCTGVVEEGGGAWRYDHRLRRGINRASHALRVAKLAGMPGRVVRDAEALLARAPPAAP